MIAFLSKYGVRVGVFLAGVLLFAGASGQIVINEFSASNATQVEDPDFMDYPDWIELFNPGVADLNLKGYFISDDFETPDKWQITEDVYITAGAYLLIWADGNNLGLHTSFKLAAAGEEIGIYSPGQILLDSVSYSEQQADVSFGRVPDGGAKWGFYQQATPGSSNVTEVSEGFVGAGPDFSIRGGFYSGPLSVELSSYIGGDIRFTLDGSEPDETADLYVGGIPINSTTILRAKILKDSMIPGPAATMSYFINENAAEENLPVVSIASAPGNFWDPDEGIYVQNFKPLWDIPINIELFENDGSDRAAFNELAGAKINGLYSWQLPQKMLGVYFKKAYGSGKLDYPLLRQRERSSYKSFALRASGSDWSYTLFRDILGQHATLYNMNIDIMAYRPAVVYFNGEYMGVHNIREKVDDDYIEKSYQLEAGSFDLVENEDYAEAGDLEAYHHLASLLSMDLSVQANYDTVASLVDIENFTDYVIAEMATGNTSISHNVMAWKPKGSGKWKWILMDVDRGFFKPTSNQINFYLAQDVLPLKKLMENPSYTSYFGSRLAAHMYTSFNPVRMMNLIDGHMKDIEAEIPRHLDKWMGTTSGYGDAIPSEEYWRKEVNDLKTFVSMRPFALVADLESYEFGDPVNLMLGTYPANAGKIYLDSLEVPGAFCSGPFPKNTEIRLRAEPVPGFEFKGWALPSKKLVFTEGAAWKYLDTGADPGAGWISDEYNDGAWKTGLAQLGYGEGDETTVLSYGPDSRNKYITTYFRKTFTLSADQKNVDRFIIDLQFDDGAIVYVNGTEVARPNMEAGDQTYQTHAFSVIDSELESAIMSFQADPALFQIGENVIAVEIHQYDGTSSDISFDMELSGYRQEPLTLLPQNSTLSLSLEKDHYLNALFTSTGHCMIPDTISGELTLSPDCSPYLVRGDVFVAENGTLIIEPGVEIWMPEDASVFVRGAIQAIGTQEQEIIFRLHPDKRPGSWGVFSFQNTREPSILKHLVIEDASRGPDPIRERAAISAFRADLVLDHLILEENFGDPILSLYSDIILTNSSLHSDVTGDLINVKYGTALIEGCQFVGNNCPDTDAIDYDEITDGVIRNSRISHFLGANSDAIDLGEKAGHILIDSILAYNITDKGVSVGQRSSSTVQNSVFINCNMGVGVKDSGQVIINQSLFYNNAYGVASFEKNAGYAGGNASIWNSIFSNSPLASVFMDSKSTLELQYCLSDNTIFPEEYNNLLGNPLFSDPSFYNFDLLSGSPGILSGYYAGVNVDMGSIVSSFSPEPEVMISQLYINPVNLDHPEFIALYNPSSEMRDLSGYSISKGVSAIIPEGTLLGSKEVLYLVDDWPAASRWSLDGQIIVWESGKLSNSGERIQLEDSHGIIIDFLDYEDNGAWPSGGFSGPEVFQLSRPGLDNHFPESWTLEHFSHIVSDGAAEATPALIIYPNPTRDFVTLESAELRNQEIEIFNIGGQVLGRERMNDQGIATIQLAAYGKGMLFIKAGNIVQKVVILE